MTHELAALPSAEFMVVIVNATIQRGEPAPMATIRSLADLIATMGITLSAHQRINVAETFRDVADKLERPLLDSN
ncbi:hypothetical protein IVA95_16205 [Bradyrhizobium sp. 157]|uniref:hypothetical protein n=1 Tax=Bradyrhizobium sp. 157 TaxID=2782631 RepID=UPI001FFB1BDD|nr:hypothetical protein [Bradyrhizobium sp. 157]MCK1639104.1 hypothetical protein [Bradyrhizobium sp. 157]